MYAWIWRKLPFGLPGKLAGSLLLATTMVALLWYVVFPWAEPLLPFDDVQVTQDDSGVPDAPDGDFGPGDDDAVDDAPPGDEHDLPYDTDRNNTPPPDEDE
ncbi:hypothetical protein HCA58_06140 [Micromonospora sp. HNM0581]|uniref:hypothetical protein n=1 Tax=Micromonospora sp. HNM0581 TaxID=2716341 RepID=UPI00146B0CF4|nr:hypothetical protein [Micromonospora sp. HNM0581]NLU77981.1 hypothetical protein [Micromonospora sp. HNM0581]